MKRNNSHKKKPIFCRFGYVDYIILASSISIALGEELSTNDLNILSTFFAVLADELALIGSVESACAGDNDDVFVPPIPDVAITSRSHKPTTNKHYKKSNNMKKCKKKIIRKKIKKK